MYFFFYFLVLPYDIFWLKDNFLLSWAKPMADSKENADNRKTSLNIVSNTIKRKVNDIQCNACKLFLRFRGPGLQEAGGLYSGSCSHLNGKAQDGHRGNALDHMSWQEHYSSSGFHMN